MGARVLLLASLVSGCTATWTASTTQPRLILGAGMELRRSVPLSIVVRDMELPRALKLKNEAYYTMVSRDRVTFHVTFHHKWDDMADLRTWDIYLEDERGWQLIPEEVDQRVLRALQLGTRKPVYRGVADINFYRRDVFTESAKMTLVLAKPGYVYKYVWRSEDQRFALVESDALISQR